MLRASPPPRDGRISRRAVLRYSLALLAFSFGRHTLAAESAGFTRLPSNFRSIYSDPKLRRRFYPFLENVFHLYPEERFDRLIAEVTSQYATDGEIYRKLRDRLPEISPRLSSLTYALPALRKQKLEMARETCELLGQTREVRGYMEIGTTGRYLNALKKRVAVRGPIYVVNDEAPIYSLEDIVERGQLGKVGRYVPMGNYEEFDQNQIPPGSVELATNYIGFHHAPADKLDGFVRAIHRALAPGGRLVVRDHDVDGPEMDAIAGLAHDVFNAGVGIAWEKNQAQIRNFRSIADLGAYLEKRGFERGDALRLQDGDPTRNALVVFAKSTTTAT